MATLHSTLLLIVFSLMGMLISPANSLTCTSQKFTNNKLYSNCTDLPSLSSYLHWTYDSANSSLSIAFLAPPAKSNGWIAWAINPTGTGMAGSQALIAFKQSNGSMSVQTYNISSYQSIVQSKIAFDVSDASAEDSGGLMKIFATLALPTNTTEVNQVWQVGGSVTGGVPDKHEFLAANLNAKGTLELVNAQSNGTTTGGNSTNTTTSNNGTNTTTGTPSSGGGDSRIREGFCVFLLVFGSLVLLF